MSQQDRLRGDGTTDLEDVECFKLDIFALVPEQVHHHLEIGLACNVSGHDAEISTIQENLAQQLE